MKIAILLFGQPRFFSMTKNQIRDEFNLPGHDVDFFVHFWNKIGYIPQGDEHEYDEKELLKEIKEGLPNSVLTPQPKAKNVVINSYDILNEFIEYMVYFGTKIHKDGYLTPRGTTDRHLPIGKNKQYLRYKFGQHWSMRECFKRIKAYEDQNNFQYDIVVKVRTDILYKPKETYNSEEEYYRAKEEMYANMCLNTPMVKCTALRYVDLTEKRKDKTKEGYNQAFYYFYNNHFRIDKQLQTDHNCEEEVGWIKHTENYNKRLAFNDWTLVANRKGAEIMFDKWFENYFLTLAKDIKNNKTSSWFISQSDHCLQGQFLLNYDIAASRISPRRDVRLINPSEIKKDVTIEGKILVHNKKQVREDCIKHFRR